MSTDFTPGQNARAIRNTQSHGGVEVVKNAQVTVEAYFGGREFMARLQGETDLIFFIEDFEPVEPPEPYKAPIVRVPGLNAPLDPAKVKAGDTVTLTAGKATVTDEVRYVSSSSLPVHLDLGILGAYIVGVDHGVRWTLTDHQPAPEPDRVGFLHDYLTGRGDEELLEGLVVIDPADVDVDALVEAAHTDHVLYGDTTPDQMRGAALRMLAVLGIEVAR